MADIAQIVASALELSKAVEGKHIRRTHLLDKGEREDESRFVHDLARMIASGAPFVPVPIPDGCAGKLHEVSGVIVREIADYDFYKDAQTARFDAALQL